MKKRNKVLIFSLVLALCAALFSPAALAEDTPEEAPPYTQILISSAEEWLAFGENCTLDAWSRDKEIILTADISLAGIDYQPIPSFGGLLRGEGYSISDLHISSGAAPSGLFGETQEGAQILDLKVRGSLAPSGDGSTVGGIVGRNRGLLQNCSFTGSVTGKSRTGGLVGLNTASGMVERCQMHGSVSGKSMTGGIVGRNEGTVQSCRNEGSINIESSDPTLNREGLSLSSLLTAAEDNSLSLVNVATDSGGICGYSVGRILDCVNQGAVGHAHIGYNVGGIVGRNAGFLDSCRNLGSVSGRRDIGGIAGQMEPHVDMVLTEDMAQKLQQQMNGLSYLLNETVKDAHSSSSDAASRLDRIAQSFQPLAEAINGSEDPAELAGQLGAMFGSMAGISGQLNGVASGLRKGADTLSSDMQQVVRQLNAVNTTLSQAIDAAGSIGSTDVLSDTSQENVDAVTDGKALSCHNQGPVEGDLNVGGVAGSMGVEVELDPEGDLSGGLSSMLHREYQLKSILQACTNRGDILARKDCAGSVCGSMELGLIYGCYGYGSVESESGDYVGGIVGLTQGVVRACWAKCSLRGGSFLGGIAGSGARNESTGTVSTVAECRAMVSIPRATQYTGAIAGGEDGSFSDNLFVAGELAGINRLNRAGQAEPISYEEMISLEGVPSPFRILSLDFRLEGENVASRVFRYGTGFGPEVYPEIPEREGYYGCWDVEDLSELRFDTVVNAQYLPVVSALRSEASRSEGRPVFFAEGSFRDEDALEARQVETEPLEAIAGAAESVLLSGLRGQLSQAKNVSEQWVLDIPADGADSHVIRFAPPGGEAGNTVIYVKTAGGWEKAECGSFGSYLTFPVNGSTAELAAVETTQAWWVIGVYALGALLLLLGAGWMVHSLANKRKKP
ncbi:MAG: hypothetical protein IKO22_00815 [Oscillospiraceae bacterium]|nr:hypothetical protein [Oscillospiraceae bacterium]